VGALNSEIVKRLEESLEVHHELTAFFDSELIEELINDGAGRGIYPAWQRYITKRQLEERKWGKQHFRTKWITIGRK
jgi:hypothetical protein